MSWLWLGCLALTQMNSTIALPVHMLPSLSFSLSLATNLPDWQDVRCPNKRSIAFNWVTSTGRGLEGIFIVWNWVSLPRRAGKMEMEDGKWRDRKMEIERWRWRKVERCRWKGGDISSFSPSLDWYHHRIRAMRTRCHHLINTGEFIKWRQACKPRVTWWTWQVLSEDHTTK